MNTTRSAGAAEDDWGWMAHGSCVATPGLPWITDTAHAPSVLVEEMEAVCAACPVRLACLAHVAQTRVTGGFWAGADRDPHARGAARGSDRLLGGAA